MNQHDEWDASRSRQFGYVPYEISTADDNHVGTGVGDCRMKAAADTLAFQALALGRCWIVGCEIGDGVSLNWKSRNRDFGMRSVE